ncbi:hypothetical protein [Rhizobium laguerreae]|uniref:hypothetical protein n=1 Tax=Rhizobium laguerreae TaxID=1076926 RepID=UPI001C928554|nr:hypothetical protein [Rhizobium laguerreae]MBY3363768.1 hypothetical protein [Rhizobium laguerreae]
MRPIPFTPTNSDEEYFDPVFEVPASRGYIEVSDIVEPNHSPLIGLDGQPLRYTSQAMGFIGFVKLGVAA